MAADRVGVYARNSTVEQAQSRTEENQVHEVLTWLRTLPVVIIGEPFIDAGVSGTDPSRSAYQALLAHLDDFDGIAVYDIDRLTRDFDIGIELIRTLRRKKKKLYEASRRKVYDYNSFSDLFFHVNMVMLSDEEHHKINERRRVGMERYRREHGLSSEEWVHRPRKPINWTKYVELAQSPAKFSEAAIARALGIHPSTLKLRLRDPDLPDHVKRYLASRTSSSSGSGGSS